ncbi:MAG: hypothetical protein PHN44_00140 [Candidatus Marinimicrobia bacterium]|nr:hypothetical protein [Candidatus Neomarinimicrobiota bacterium]
MFKILLKLFTVACFAAADDYKVDPCKVTMDGSDRFLVGLRTGSTTIFKNVMGYIQFPFNDSVCGAKEVDIGFCRATPVADANYAGLTTGSIMHQLEITSTVVTNHDIWIKDGTGASDWAKVLKARTSAGTARTAATKEVEIQGTNSGTGDYRGVYAKITLTHATAGSGDAVRGYIVTTGGANAARGGQFTAEVGAAGSVTGLAVGVEGHIMVASGLTLNAGTYACIDAETNNESTLLNVTGAAHIRIHDAGTYGMKSIIELGTIVGRSTNAASLGPYTYDSGGITAAATAAKIAIRVTTPDGVFYLLGWAAGEISGT